MGAIRVVKVAEGRSLDVRNNVVRSITVTYFVDDHGPFTETGSPEDFANGSLKTRMQTQARNVVAIQQ